MSPPPFAIATVGPLASGKTTLSFALALHFGSMSTQEKEDLAFPYLKYSRQLSGPWMTTPSGQMYCQSINPLYLSYVCSGRLFTHVDTAGLPKFSHLTLWGMSQVDAVILVLRASAGVDDAVREFLRMIRASGFSNVIVYLNQIVESDAELGRVSELELREALAKIDYRTPVVIHGNASKAYANAHDDSLQTLVQTLAELPKPVLSLEAPFLFRISEARQIYGQGTAVLGRLERGRLSPGDTADHLPIKACPEVPWPVKPIDAKEAGEERYRTDRERHGSRPITIHTIERFRTSLPGAEAGDLVGLLIKEEFRETFHRGDVLAAPGSTTLVKRIGVRFALFEEKGPLLRQDLEIIVHLGPQAWAGLIQTIDQETHNAVIELFRPIPLDAGSRLVIRHSGQTIGWALVSYVMPYQPDLQPRLMHCRRCRTVTHTLYLETLTKCSTEKTYCPSCQVIVDKEQLRLGTMFDAEKEKEKLLRKLNLPIPPKSDAG